jgi:hypothetical protein
VNFDFRIPTRVGATRVKFSTVPLQGESTLPILPHQHLEEIFLRGRRAHLLGFSHRSPEALQGTPQLRAMAPMAAHYELWCGVCFRTNRIACPRISGEDRPRVRLVMLPASQQEGVSSTSGAVQFDGHLTSGALNSL